MRIYRPSERHEFDPGPCPKCGGTKHRVNWVDVHESHEEPGSALVPGTVECLNPDCEWGPPGVDVSEPSDRWVRKTRIEFASASAFDASIPADAPTVLMVRLCICMHTPAQHDPETGWCCRLCPCRAFTIGAG